MSNSHKKFKKVESKLIKDRNGRIIGYFDGIPRAEVPVGYCHFHGHRGFVSKSLLSSHNCLSRGCWYFSKYYESPVIRRKRWVSEAKKLRKAYNLDGLLKPLYCSNCGVACEISKNTSRKLSELNCRTKDSLRDIKLFEDGISIYLSLRDSAVDRGWILPVEGIILCKECTTKMEGK